MLCFVQSTVQVSKNQYEELDYFIGYEAQSRYSTHKVTAPIESGMITEWSLMEKFWHRSIFDYLRCDPEETVFIMTESPMNPPENREQLAEIMFETFNVKGLHIAVQAVLALISNCYLTKNKDLTGTVLDSGDGITHIIPIVSAPYLPCESWLQFPPPHARPRQLAWFGSGGPSTQSLLVVSSPPPPHHNFAPRRSRPIFFFFF